MSYRDEDDEKWGHTQHEYQCACDDLESILQDMDKVLAALPASISEDEREALWEYLVDSTFYSQMEEHIEVIEEVDGWRPVTGYRSRHGKPKAIVEQEVRV